MLAAQANVGSRENDVLLSQLEKEIAKNNLLFLLNEEDTSIEIEPSNSLTITPYNVDIYQQLKQALSCRRDYKIIANQLKSLDIDIAVKKMHSGLKLTLKQVLQKTELNQPSRTLGKT